eukprot:m.582771 g.582771  ORF g.582771 m.582771 type:complete len:282 (+) comp57947_c0_seq10:532-1377(+)
MPAASSTRPSCPSFWPSTRSMCLITSSPSSGSVMQTLFRMHWMPRPRMCPVWPGLCRRSLRSSTRICALSAFLPSQVDPLFMRCHLFLRIFGSSNFVRGISNHLQGPCLAHSQPCMTGAGVSDLFEAVEDAKAEYFRDYKPVIDAQRLAKQTKEAEEQGESFKKLRQDLQDSGHVVVDVRPGIDLLLRTTFIPLSLWGLFLSSVFWSDSGARSEEDVAADSYASSSDEEDPSKELRPSDLHEAFQNAQGLPRPSVPPAAKRAARPLKSALKPPAAAKSIPE